MKAFKKEKERDNTNLIRRKFRTHVKHVLRNNGVPFVEKLLETIKASKNDDPTGRGIPKADTIEILELMIQSKKEELFIKRSFKK